MNDSQKTKGISLPKTRIHSVAEFVEHAVEWQINEQAPTAFRGQRFYGWRSVAKIFREDLSLHSLEHQAVRDIVSIHPAEFSSDSTMFDRLVRMQHYGFPTRLLDVTTNSLVALWFASEPSSIEEEFHGSVQALLMPKSRQRYYDSDRVSCMANIANLKKSQQDALLSNAGKDMTIEEFNETPEADMLVYYVGHEKPNFRPIINPKDLLMPVYVRPKMSNKRIIAQSGAFLLYATNNRTTNGEKGIKADRVWIHEEDKSEIRKHLGMLGINESTLFPEIDKTAKFITEQYGLNGRERAELL